MPCLPKQQAIVNAARELYATHGIMPVPVAGKVPLGRSGWNIAPLEVRMRNLRADECTGLGMQCGLVFHPVLGPIEVRCLDCDIDDQTQRDTFAGTLQTFFPVKHWRWGRRPATIIFTQPGIIKQEKFGPVQLLGQGKQAVWWGDYQNKIPLPGDPSVYWHQGPSIFEAYPPIVPAATLKLAIEASLAAAGIPVHPGKNILSEAVPLSTADLAMLTPDNFAQFKREIEGMLSDVDNSPTGSGRGTKLYHAALKFGALIKASGTAPMLTGAMHEVGVTVVEYETIDNPILAEIGRIADEAFAMLPGSLGQGDQRDFARGVGASMGLSQYVAVLKAKNAITSAGAVQQVLSPGFGQRTSAAALTTPPLVNADGALDDHPLPSFNSSEVLQEVVVNAPKYGIDPAGAVAVAVTLACNLAATKFDISNKGKAVGPHQHMLAHQSA